MRMTLVGLRMQTPTAALRDLNAPEESVNKPQETIEVRFVNASVYPARPKIATSSWRPPP